MLKIKKNIEKRGKTGRHKDVKGADEIFFISLQNRSLQIRTDIVKYER